MILSLENNFLLLKNQKVGGTSLEVPLSKIMPENAIITPKTSDDPAWKLSDEPIYKDYNPRNCEGFYNHMSYSEINSKISLSGIKSYIFIRNPFEMVLSHFFHRLKFEGLNTKWMELTNKRQSELLFKYFNGELGWGWLKSNKYLYTSKEGNIQVNEFLRYENGIEKEINKVLPLHNLPTITLDIREKSFRPKQIHYRDVFLDNHIKLISKEWCWELEYFGYKYE
jgi:hypothetical protein